MSRQGYLIVYDKCNHPAICYFSLEDGFLRQYATMECTKCLREIQLSGCKLTIKAQKRTEGVPNSFFLETRRVFVKDRSYTLGNTKRIEFSACSSDDRKEWGKALFSWQRYYWRDPQTSSSSEKSVIASETHFQLEQIIAKYFVQKPTSRHSISFVAANHPLSFLRRNVYALQRSLSLTVASTSVNATKLETNEEPTDNMKDKLAKEEYPEAAKSNNICEATAVTPHYFSGRFSHNINQETH
ncbi:unnamed protein product [Peronospora belbahrii]|uniref:PH domain-containing protein n=1 Tax=Peronospora belbahrii TaxID=622444 RepID=A0AAU9KPD3_9STRA|nr:unnamed protein product [Peronospora belbahrii]CAH0514162.1 unnamed protein product [Peronospora belbahrii]